MPSLSVIVPVRDARPWIAASFRSLWRQTFTDLEVLAVDDGSRDGSSEWLDEEARREPRLRVIHTAARGLPAALMTGLAAASAPWIARHDADDVSHRSRFALQWSHLAGHGGTHVMGTRVRLFPRSAHGIGMERWRRRHNALLSHEAIRREVLTDSPLCHGTAIVERRALVDAGGWRDNGWPEDADLWVRLAEAGARFAKLPRVLYAWRQHPASSTRNDPRYGRERFIALQRDALIRGALLGRPPRTVIGTGRSVGRWREALAMLAPRVIETTKPERVRVHSLEAPILLVLASMSLRERWREVLTSCGNSEMQDFIFTV